MAGIGRGEAVPGPSPARCRDPTTGFPARTGAPADLDPEREGVQGLDIPTPRALTAVLVNVHRSAGMQKIYTDSLSVGGEYVDRVVYGLLREEWGSDRDGDGSDA